jgi:hypothetical protein
MVPEFMTASLLAVILLRRDGVEESLVIAVGNRGLSELGGGRKGGIGVDRDRDPILAPENTTLIVANATMFGSTEQAVKVKIDSASGGKRCARATPSYNYPLRLKEISMIDVDCPSYWLNSRHQTVDREEGKKERRGRVRLLNRTRSELWYKVLSRTTKESPSQEGHIALAQG